MKSKGQFSFFDLNIILTFLVLIIPLVSCSEIKEKDSAPSSSYMNKGDSISPDTPDETKNELVTDTAEYKIQNCESYIRTILLTKKKLKVDSTPKIIVGENQIATYHYDYNMQRCSSHGGYNHTIYIELPAIVPLIYGVEYTLPNTLFNVKVDRLSLYRITFKTDKFDGKVIFHEPTFYEKGKNIIKASIFIYDRVNRIVLANDRNTVFSPKEKILPEKKVIPYLNKAEEDKFIAEIKS